MLCFNIKKENPFLLPLTDPQIASPDKFVYEKRFLNSVEFALEGFENPSVNLDQKYKSLFIFTNFVFVLRISWNCSFFVLKQMALEYNLNTFW